MWRLTVPTHGPLRNFSSLMRRIILPEWQDGRRMPFPPPDSSGGIHFYNWEYHKATGYEWWIRRIAYCLKLYDVVRIDHFRGFDEYYAIPMVMRLR